MKKLYLCSLLFGWVGLTATNSHSALITELWTVELPVAYGDYQIGHEFKFMATFDDKGKYFYEYDDDTNEIITTYYSDDPRYRAIAFSDAEISIVSGLDNPPPGTAPHDKYSFNYSAYLHYHEGGGVYATTLDFQADDLKFTLISYNGEEDRDGFRMYEYFIDGTGFVTERSTDFLGGRDNFFITRSIVEPGNPVPEPATMLLFAAGMAGLAAAGRRKKR